MDRTANAIVETYPGKGVGRWTLIAPWEGTPAQAQAFTYSTLLIEPVTAVVREGRAHFTGKLDDVEHLATLL